MTKKTDTITIIKTPSEREMWDNFVRKNQAGSIHQISGWGQFQQKISGREKPTILAIFREKKIIAGALMVEFDTNFFAKKWWYCPRGPLLAEQNFEDKTLRQLLQAMSDFIREQKGLFLRIDPYFSRENWQHFPESQQLLTAGTQNYQPTDTLMLDLTQSDEDLLKQMKPKGRYNIKQSKKFEIQYEAVSATKYQKMPAKKQAECLDAFWKLNTETTSRDKFSGHDKSYYHHLLASFGDEVVLFFAKKNGVPVATAISTFFAGKSIYYFGASTSSAQYRKMMAPYGLQWHMIQHAKTQQCFSYDFLGIAPEGEEKHAYAGISVFKWKFGGTRATYAGSQELVVNRFWYRLYRLLKFAKKFL